MEAIITLPSLALIALSAMCFYAISLWHKAQMTSCRAPAPNLPPGTKGLPYLGETLDFVRCNQRGNPECFILSRMRKFSAKIFTTSIIGEDVVVFCGAAGNKHLLTSPNELVRTWVPPTLRKILFSPENKDVLTSEFIRDGRIMTNEYLKPEFIKKEVVELMDRMSKQHFDKHWASERQVHVSEQVKIFSFDVVCRVFLNLDDPEKVSRLMHLFRDIMSGILTMPINFPGTPFYRAVKSTNAIKNEIMSIIKQRKLEMIKKIAENKISDIKSSSKDLLSHILLSTHDRDGGFPSDVVIGDRILAFLFASHDTTCSTITCMVKFLADLPHVYAQVLAEQMEIAKDKKRGEVLNWGDIQKMKYTWNAVRETMRMAPPSPGMFREVLDDFTYASFTIPKGWKAYWTGHSTYKNPEYFENPYEFDPTRFEGNGPLPYSFLPFGGGYHVCPARNYVKAQILAFIHNLVTQYGFEKVLPDEKIVYISTGLPANGLPLRIHRMHIN